MEEEKNKSRGHITVGVGTDAERKLDIVDFVQATYKDNRLISICGIEDDTITATVENPGSTGRAVTSTIWLSRESFLGIISTAFLYFAAKGENMSEILKEISEQDNIDYKFSDNLSSLDEEE